MKVVNFAYEIIQMQDRIDELESQVTHLTWFKEQYDILLSSTQKHNNSMMRGMLELCLVPGVALRDADRKRDC